MTKTTPSTVSYLRPAVALMIPLMLFGVVFGYSSFVASLPTMKQPDFTQLKAAGDYQIELTLTFVAQPDWGDYENRSFYLLTSDHASAEGDRTIASSKQPILPGEPLRFDVAGKVVEGTNQFDLFVGVPADDFAPPADDDFGEVGLDSDEPSPGTGKSFQQERAVRIRVLRDGVPVTETTIWSEPGQPIRNSFTLVVNDEETAEEE